MICGVVILPPKGKKIPIIDLFAGFQEKTPSIDKANEKSVTNRDVSVLKGWINVVGKKTHCILIHKPIHTGQTDSDLWDTACMWCKEVGGKLHVFRACPEDT